LSPLTIVQVCSARTGTYGAVMSLLTLSEGLRDAGHRVVFATFRGRAFGEEVRRRGFEVHEVDCGFKVSPRAVLQLARVFREVRADVVHTHLSTSSVNGALAARLARLPSISTVHGISNKWSYWFADRIVAVSDQARSHLIAQGLREARVDRVYNGVTLPAPARERVAWRHDWGVAESVPVLGTVARLVPAKGVADAIRAFATVTRQHPGSIFVVAGDGPERERLQHLADELGVGPQVRFLGYVRDVAGCLSAMDLFLFPSHREAMGIAVVEALAAGLPVVSTDVGGLPEVLTPECGVLVPAHDPGAMADAIRGLLSRQESSGAFSVERAAQFSVATMVGETIAVYRRDRRVPAGDRCARSNAPQFMRAVRTKRSKAGARVFSSCFPGILMLSASSRLSFDFRSM